MSSAAPDPGTTSATPRRGTSVDPSLRDLVGGPSLEDLDPEDRAPVEEFIARMAETQQEVLRVPAGVIVVNHARGLLELAVLHLNQTDPRMDEARLAIDTAKAVLDAGGTRLGEEGELLAEMLRQVQIAFVQRHRERSEPPDPGHGPENQPGNQPENQPGNEPGNRSG